MLVLCLGFSSESYMTALSVAVPLLAVMGALSLTVEIAFAYIRYSCTLVHYYILWL